MASNGAELSGAVVGALLSVAADGAVDAVEPLQAARTIAALAASAASRGDHQRDRVILRTPPLGLVPGPFCLPVQDTRRGADHATPSPGVRGAGNTSIRRLRTSPPTGPGPAGSRVARAAGSASVGPRRAMLAHMEPIRVALAQIAPVLGQLDQNLERHHALLADARAGGADLVVFPELGLTGYQLQDLASEVSMRLDDPRVTALAAATTGLSVVVSFVEESADHRLFIAAALFEDGTLRHVHRKLYLPTYGLFDERRFFAAGDLLRAVPSRLGVGIGLAVCEDFWHLPVPQLLALDGAQILINVSSSPGRDLAATNEVGLGTATSWRTLMRTYAQLTTSYVVFCNRVGVDESISFWGGSEVIAPTGAPIMSAPLYDEGLYFADLTPADIRRERIALPLLRDERPELQVRELERIVRERAGMADDATSDPGAEPGFDVVAGVTPPRPIGFGARGHE